MRIAFPCIQTCVYMCPSVCWSQQYWSEWSVSKVVPVFRNSGYDFWGVGGDLWRWLCRHVHLKISTHVDGGPSGGSRVPRPGERGPTSAWAEICHKVCFKTILWFTISVIFIDTVPFNIIASRSWVIIENWILNLGVHEAEISKLS